MRVVAGAVRLGEYSSTAAESALGQYPADYQGIDINGLGALLSLLSLLSFMVQNSFRTILRILSQPQW